MMRQPTPLRILHRWWLAALDDRAPDMHDGQPECGYFKRRMVKGGPWVPVRIFVEREIDDVTGELCADEVLRIEIEGLDAGDPGYHWTYLNPISKREYDHLIDYRLRDSRMIDPRQRLDLSASPTPPQGVI